jgi:AcrR family transcriptional regulator
VAAARRRFRADGLAAATLGSVAADAGLNRPHLYRYFADKAELIAAVVAAETAEINDRRLVEVAGLPAFADQVVRALQLAVELIRGDEFWSTLISPENVPYTAYAAANSDEVRAANVGFWVPLLEAARARGEVRPDLTDEDVLAWLLGLQFLFMERPELFPTGEHVARYSRLFVVPALAP